MNDVYNWLTTYYTVFDRMSTPVKQVPQFDIILHKIPYYFKYKMPSNLRCTQFMNVSFRKKIRKVHIPQI
jgi:hypothetical protein